MPVEPLVEEEVELEEVVLDEEEVVPPEVELPVCGPQQQISNPFIVVVCPLHTAQLFAGRHFPPEQVVFTVVQDPVEDPPVEEELGQIKVPQPV